MILFILLFLLSRSVVRTYVIELSDSALGLLDERACLINFYAPWCGFCRNLEPVFEKASIELKTITPSVQVARLDATIHHSAGKIFNIKGYPTIKFINGSTSYTYTGDRSTRSIVAFTVRASGNPVKRISSTSEFESNYTYWGQDALFILLNPQHGFLQAAYYRAADRLRLFVWLFEASKDELPQRFSNITSQLTDNEEVLVVVKGENLYTFPGVEDNPTAHVNDLWTDQVTRWLLHERYPVLPHVTETDLWDFGTNELTAAVPSTTHTFTADETGTTGSVHRTYRLVALVLLNPSSSSSAGVQSTRFKELVFSLARKRLGSLAKHFQFAWTDQVESVSEIALLSLSAPSLVVIDPVTRVVYLNPNQDHLDGLFSLEEDVLVAFLVLASKGQLTGFGGHTFVVRLRRFLRMALAHLYHLSYTSPLLALVILGVPTVLVSFVCYLCCCLDSPELSDEQFKAHMASRCPRGERPQVAMSCDTGATNDSESTDPELVVRRRVSYGSEGNWKRCEKKFTVVGPVCSEEEIDAKRNTLHK